MVVLQNLDSVICTVYGDSESAYGRMMSTVLLLGQGEGDTTEGPQQGIGQGNGAAPIAWAVVSTPLLQVMREQGHTTCFKALLSKDEVMYVGYAFVEDANLL
jgi:hypothetical protein